MTPAVIAAALILGTGAILALPRPEKRRVPARKRFK